MPLCSYTPICLYTARGVDTLICPHTPLCICILRGFCMLWVVVRGPLHVGHLPYTSPCMEVPPHMSYTAPLNNWLPCASVCFGGYLHVIWGIFPLCWGFGGVSPSVGGFRGISTWGVHMLLVVHSRSSLSLMYLSWL